MNTLDIIEQAKNGKNSAFDVLLKEYNSLIRHSVKSLVKDDCDAEEIICIVMIKLYKNINKYTTSISFEAWIKTIAINTCIDYFRKVKNNQSRLVSLDSLNYDCLSDDSCNDDIRIASEDRHNKIVDALNLLPKRKKRVVELYFFENKSYKEIAKLLSTPEGTIKSDLSRAKQYLKKHLT